MCCVSHFCRDSDLSAIFFAKQKMSVWPKMKVRYFTNNKKSAAFVCASASRYLETIPVTIHVCNRRWSYPNPCKELSLTIRACDAVTWGHGDGCTSSVIVRQETGGIASAFCSAVARERVKRMLLFQMFHLATCCPRATGWAVLV
jgi:hypothetical protein